MKANPFIERPVFAAVISIVFLLAGLVAMRALPIEQYPQIVPPQVVVQATYPGASAETVAQTVAAPLEQQINGVENMLYMQSTNSSSGTMRLTVTFQIGTNPDQATINVNNRVQRAVSTLPAEVTRQGLIVNKQSSSILALVTMSSSDPRYDAIYLSNYALLNVIDELKRIPGVGDASLFGAKNYSMRVWLRPDKLAQYNLTPSDVATAIREQNAQFAAGRFGEEPTKNDLAFTYSVNTEGRLPDAKAFEDIIIRADVNAAALRLRDVARIELGAQNYAFIASHNDTPTVPIGIYLQPGANALGTLDAVRARMDEMKLNFPQGISHSIPFDTTKFVQVSIHEVIKTFAEAMVLVIIVVFIFLQNWRATLIPVLAVPVSIIGTFAGMYALGFSINLLTLFGLVLAIGIVVDDAIVVLENVERIMTTEHLSPREAATKAMQEVSGPVIAIVLVLCAVFVPVAFMGGLAGEMYRQFAVTIAVSVTISGIVALTLSPALCALILKPGHSEPWAPFRWFNRMFDRATSGYTTGVRFLLRRAALGMMLFAVMIAVTGYLFMRIPGSLVPEEDQGSVFVAAMLPPAASLTRTQEVMAAVNRDILSRPQVADVISFSGFDLLASAQKPSAGASFVQLKDWSERTAAGESAADIARSIMISNSSIQEAIVLAFTPPPIMGMSNTGGFEGFVQDRSGAGIQKLMEATDALVAAAAKRPELEGVRTTMVGNVPQYKVRIDRDKVKALNVPISAIFETMQSTFGSLYVNDFTLFGRNFQVNLSAEANFRERPDDLKQVFVKSAGGAMIPIDALLTVERIVGPDQIDRFNAFAAAKVMGNPAPGYSSGQAIEAMRAAAREALPEGYQIAWSGQAFQEIATGGAGNQAILFGLIMVFLILAAQYERWSLPIAVVMAVPFALFGALIAIWLRGLSNDVYFQIGLVTLIGLASKNAILIVEFAAMKRREGLNVVDAAIEAAKLRFRPIVMTSLAFILGCVPLAISSGAGAASRHSIGTGVIGGMLAATFLAVFFIPLFYRLVSGRRAEAESIQADTGRANTADAQPHP
ncbi:transporter [Afipia sp. P52-10]|uniref:efflux RND transporter permease subunit n=1 Tax=Afipia sp. P52-10 TaxID=1429916 RepID=UPI0003DF2DD8|nr:efflux RND transporter permease subunit [Afipia sp. P52-10]ETR76746.1 transporter [Afipia sp. P52-10]